MNSSLSNYVPTAFFCLLAFVRVDKHSVNQLALILSSNF